jgi:hypothetical protein
MSRLVISRKGDSVQSPLVLDGDKPLQKNNLAIMDSKNGIRSRKVRGIIVQVTRAYATLIIEILLTGCYLGWMTSGEKGAFEDAGISNWLADFARKTGKP